MSYFFAKNVLLRLPAQPYINYNRTKQAFLTEPIFLAGIYLSSPMFYAQLQKSGFTWDNLTLKERLTLQKYVNRICFRPTPFGLFAAVSLLEWGPLTTIPPVSYHSLIAHVQPDRSLKLRIGAQVLESIKDELIYEVNPTVYRVLKEFRFIRTDIDAAFQKRTYHLQSTEYSVVLRELLNYCRSGKHREKISAKIIQLANCDQEEGREYFEFLTDAQILIPQLRPAITGSDYLLKLPADTGISTHNRALILAVTSLHNKLKGRSINGQYFARQSRRIDRLLQKDQAAADYFNVILENKVDAGLNVKFQEPLRDALFALDSLCPADEVPALQKFAAAFQKHFEGRRIPLLTALDPECGISYQEPDQESPNPLVETLNIERNQASSRLINWSPVHPYLLDLLLKTERNGSREINLKMEDLVRLRDGREDFTTFGFSVLFRVVDNQIFMESAGGNNAPALLGRFTLADQVIAEAARLMTKRIEEVNPDLIFAEVLQLTDSHTDNVNQRENLWSYELPLTAAAGQAGDRQVNLKDLYVQVEGTQVYLWSEKHQKFVIPRLTSAYNHSLNKLPLFRFLADVPYQYGRNNLSFELSSFFPGLNYYPRVTYQGTIISPATWVLKEFLILQLAQASDADLINKFKQITSDLNLPSSFQLTEGDQQLAFYRDRNADIHFFVACIRQKKQVIIKELMLDNAENALVHDQQNQPFCAQYNAYLLPASAFKLGASRDFNSSGHAGRKFIPGSEWLYLKIYTTKLSAEKLILRVAPLLKRKYTHGRVEKWFFVRFEDHAPHIRLRMKIDPKNTGEVLAAFKILLEDQIHHQVIREYQVDIYNRELERYQVAGIEPTEDFFCASSAFTMQLMKSGSTKEVQPYLIAIVSVRDLLNILLHEADVRTDFAGTTYQALLSEFSGPKIKFGLDQKFRELKQPIYEAMHDQHFYENHGLITAHRRLEKTARKLRTAINGSGDGDSDERDHSNPAQADHPFRAKLTT